MRTSMLLALGALLLIPATARAQAHEPRANVEDGFVEPGWFGASADELTWWPARFAAEGNAFHVTTGAVTAAYFHKAKVESDPVEVTGHYTVRATFHERSTAGSENPQPYGLAIGNDRKDVQAYVYLYCAA